MKLNFYSDKHFFLSLVMLVFLTGCEKDLNPEKEELPTVNNEELAAKAMRTSGEVATNWYHLQTRMMLYSNPNPSPIVTGRFFAYEGIALYESVRHGIPNAVSLSTLLYKMPQMPEKEKNNGYSWAIAANAALASLTRNMFPNLTTQHQSAIDSLEAAQYANLKPNKNSQVFRRSQEYGRAVAQVIAEWAKDDGSSRNSDSYSPPEGPGKWQPTPPAYAPAAFPYLGSYRPLLKIHLYGLIEPFKYPYSEVPGSPFYNEVYFTYKTSKNATPEQKAIARHWADVGVATGYSTPGHHLKILTAILEEKDANLGTAAMAYAKVGITLRDAFIMTWRSKYYYNLVRPVTYVQKVIEPGWLPLLITPSHPEYPAAHAVLTAAFMETMTGLFGDNYAFTDNTYTFLGTAPRHYNSFNEAAIEAGWSRIYAGLHYRFSVETGLKFGRQIGRDVIKLRLQQ